MSTNLLNIAFSTVYHREQRPNATWGHPSMMQLLSSWLPASTGSSSLQEREKESVTCYRYVQKAHNARERERERE